MSSQIASQVAENTQESLKPAAAGSGSRGLHIGLWVAQVALGAMFVMAGSWKATTPIAELAPKLPWVAGTGAALVRFIGLSELAGGLGLVLPAATRIRPGLTPLAAI